MSPRASFTAESHTRATARSSGRAFDRRVFPITLVALVALCLVPTPAVAASPADDPFAPATQQIEARFAVISAEINRLTAAGDLPAAAALAAQLQKFSSQYYASAPSSLAGPELHLVTIYQGPDSPNWPPIYTWPPPDPPRATLRVDVSITDRPVVLALGAYHAIDWDLRLAPGVQIQRVLVTNDRQSVLNLPAGFSVEMVTDSGWYWGAGKEPSRYSIAAHNLHQHTGLTIASVHGSYYGDPTQPYTIGPSNSDWRAQRILRESNSLYTQATAFSRAPGLALASSLDITAIIRQPVPGNPWSPSRIVHASAAGHIYDTLPDFNASHLAIDPDGPTYYGINSASLARRDPVTGADVLIPMTNANLGPLQWLVGVAFDTTRRRLVLASLVGDGYLRSYDPATGLWSHLASLNGVDLGALAYHAANDSFYGIGDGHVTSVRQLFRYDATGQLLSVIELDGTLVPASSIDDDIQLVDAGDYLVLLRSNIADFYEPERPLTTWSYVIDPTTGHILHSAPFIPEPSSLAACSFMFALLRRNRHGAAALATLHSRATIPRA